MVDSQDRRPPEVPWVAIAGELATAICFGTLGLFLPLEHWTSWPDALLNWHLVIIVIGAVALAVAMFQRRATWLKAATVLAAYVGLPSLMTLQAIATARSSAIELSYIVMGLGMLGQGAVLWSCLTRLTPLQ